MQLLYGPLAATVAEVVICRVWCKSRHYQRHFSKDTGSNQAVRKDFTAETLQNWSFEDLCLQGSK